MPEFKVGDKVLVEGTVTATTHDGELIGWSFHRDRTRVVPPGVLGYSEEGHEIRRGEHVPQGWSWRVGPTYEWLTGSACNNRDPGRLYECRPPERQQTVEEAARELVDQLGQHGPTVDADLVNALEAALEREGRSDG
jgi:hypothetical protein